MRTISTVVAIAAALACPCFAQEGDTKPAAQPAAAPAAKAPEKPSASWVATDRSPEAIEKAKAILAASAKAYQAAPTISETIKLVVTMPDGMKNEQKMMTAYGAKGALRFAMDQASVVVVDGNAYFLPGDPKDKYVTQKVEGSIGKTLGAMLPGFAMPTAALAMREGATTEEITIALGGPFLQEATIAGAKSAGGLDQILLTNAEGEAIIAFDEKTHMQKSSIALMSPAGAPDGVTVAVDVAVESVIAPELARPVSFERGERTAAASISDLMGGGGAAPEMKVKVGDVAPTAKLLTLDGKEVDIASMKGKVVVLDFWATWCGPCKKGLPILEEFAVSMMGNAKVVVHPVNVWENAKDAERTKVVSAFWTNQKFTMTTLIDPESKFIEAYGFSGIPAFVIIGTDGKVAATHIGFDPKLKETLTKEVEEALAKK